MVAKLSFKVGAPPVETGGASGQDRYADGSAEADDHRTFRVEGSDRDAGCVGRITQDGAGAYQVAKDVVGFRFGFGLEFDTPTTELEFLDEIATGVVPPDPAHQP